MNKSNYQKVEGILYSHYRRKVQRQRLARRITNLETKKNRLRRDIEETNIDFNTSIPGIDYSKDKISTGFNTSSSMERDIEIGIGKLRNQYKGTLRDIVNLKRRLRNMEERIDNIDIVLSELTEEEQQLLDLKYGDRKSYRQMEGYLPMTFSTISRVHRSIINDLEKAFL